MKKFLVKLPLLWNQLEQLSLNWTPPKCCLCCRRCMSLSLCVIENNVEQYQELKYIWNRARNERATYIWGSNRVTYIFTKSSNRKSNIWQRAQIKKPILCFRRLDHRLPCVWYMACKFDKYLFVCVWYFFKIKYLKYLFKYFIFSSNIWKTLKYFQRATRPPPFARMGWGRRRKEQWGKRAAPVGFFLKIISHFFLENFSYKVGEKDENNVNFSDFNVLFVFRRGLHLPNPKSNPSRISRRISRWSFLTQLLLDFSFILFKSCNICNLSKREKAWIGFVLAVFYTI